MKTSVKFKRKIKKKMDPEAEILKYSNKLQIELKTGIDNYRPNIKPLPK